MGRKRFGPAAAALALLLVLCGCAQTYSAEELARAREEAYQSGYESGVSHGAENARDEGYAEGYAQGLDEGQAALADRESALAQEAGDAFQNGYDTGYETGYAQKKKELQAARERYVASIAPSSVEPENTASSEKPASSDTQASTASTVYITQSGKKYHVSSCKYLSKSKTAISLTDAKNRGYTPCSKCHPPQ